MNYATLETRLGTSIEPALLELALTHPSFAYENGKQSYQRLEFLGDTVLNFLVSDYLYSTYPGLTEGGLSQLRNAAISARILATAARKINLGEFIKLGKSELKSGPDNTNILADVLEAVIAAAYLSGGMAKANIIVEALIVPLINERDLVLDSHDPKKALTKLLKELGKPEPVYEHSHFGPDDKRTYYARLLIDGEEIATGNGRTIKSAENNACAQALKILG